MTVIPSNSRSRGLTGAQVRQALPGAIRKLDPRSQWRNPVLFLVWIGAVLTTIIAGLELLTGVTDGGVSVGFSTAIAVWLWLTVIFANLAESIAEGRGKAQAETLRKTRTATSAIRVDGWDERNDPSAEHTTTTEVVSSELRYGDVVVVAAGQTIPGDGDIVWGIASVDESAITGESAPVVRESGGDRSAVTGGTTVLSDRIVVKITSKPGQSFVDRMIALVEGSGRQKTPNEIALNILLASLSIVFVLVTLTLNPIASLAARPVSVTVLVALLVSWRPSASRVWTAWCSTTCWQCLDAQWRPPATLRLFCSTRLAPSPTETVVPASSSRCRVSATQRFVTRPPGPHWPTRLRRAPPSSIWPASRAFLLMPTASRGRSFPSPHRPECRASTFLTAPRSVKVLDPPCVPG